MFYCHKTQSDSTPVIQDTDAFSILHMPIQNKISVYIALHVRRDEDF
jgi:hypothetical protein